MLVKCYRPFKKAIGKLYNPYDQRRKRMGKIITYIIYFLVAVAIYVLIRAAFTGSINSNTTIGEAATEVKDGSVQTLKEIKNDASSAIDNLKNKAETGFAASIGRAAFFSYSGSDQKRERFHTAPCFFSVSLH